MIRPVETANKHNRTDTSAQEQDEYLEESLEETFPASDPIAPGRPSRQPPKDVPPTDRT
ncbi:hypothetical protein FHT93_005585 [Rhizobium sp. BK379]|nr:hypothetical protein [Rhizobium sp. BK379]